MKLLLRIWFWAIIFSAGVSAADPVYNSDMVFPPKSFGRPHGVSLLELKNHDILATWFSSKEETTKDARIYGARWNRETGKWSEPWVVISENYTKSLGNTALFRDDDGIIWMFFAAVRIGGWSGAMVDYVQSRDEGKTWTKGDILVGWPGNLPRNPPIKTDDHTMLIPLFVDFWYETNLVGSYTAAIKYKDGAIIEKTYATLDDTDAIQPAVIKLPDGRILMLTRDKIDKFIRRSYSTDNGKSWSPATITDIPNPGAGICAMYVDEMEAVMLSYNHSRKGRNPLSLALSFDGGVTFHKVADLEYRPGDEEASFEYPAMIRTSDGMYHIIWSHDKRATLKHAYFNVEWLRKAAGK